MDEQTDRMIRLFIAKARGLPRDGYTDDEWLAVVVGTVVLDTQMVMAEPALLDRWEPSVG